MTRVIQENNMYSFCYEQNTYNYTYNFDQNVVSAVDNGFASAGDVDRAE